MSNQGSPEQQLHHPSLELTLSADQQLNEPLNQDKINCCYSNRGCDRNHYEQLAHGITSFRGGEKLL